LDIQAGTTKWHSEGLEKAPESQVQQGNEQRHKIALTNIMCTVGRNATTLLSLLSHATTKILLIV